MRVKHVDLSMLLGTCVHRTSQPFMLVLAGMSPQSQKHRNGLHTQFFYIPPRSHASRCASGNFGSGSAKPCRHRSYGQRRLRPGTLCRREQQANAEREADSGRQHALHRKEVLQAARPGPLQQHPSTDNTSPFEFGQATR